MQSAGFSDFVDDIEDGENDENFMMTYTHDANVADDDKRFVSLVFKKNAEQAWDDQGKPIKDKKVLSKRGATKFSKEILGKWKKLSDEENESYI